MTKTEARFFKDEILPIIREAAEDREPLKVGMNRNPLRPMLRQLLGYIGYLEERAKKTEVS